jgi:hypothetical protein
MKSVVTAGFESRVRTAFATNSGPGVPIDDRMQKQSPAVVGGPAQEVVGTHDFGAWVAVGRRDRR